MNLKIKFVKIEEKYKINLISLILSFISTVTTPFVLKENAEYCLSNSLFSIVLWIGYFVILKTALKNYEKRLSIISLMTGVIFDCFMVIGKNIYIVNESGLARISTWLYILGILPVFYSGTLLFIKYLPKLNEYFIFYSDDMESKNEWSRRKKFFIIWGIIFSSWMPALLASYPGVYGYDSIYQVLEYLTNHIQLAHPPMHTYLLSLCVVELGKVLGSHEAGMFCYSLFQMLCLSATFSILYTIYIRTRASKLIRRFILLFFMLFPTNMIMSFSATKDVLFAAFFALSVMLLLMLAEKPELIKSMKYDISICFVFILMATWRNQGIYVIALTTVLAILLMWKYKKRILIVFTATMMFVLFYTNYVCMWFGIESVNSLKEMMSVPCVQLSRVMLYEKEILTESESELIQEYIPDYEAYSYNSGISDKMKKSLNTGRIEENPIEFVKLWLKVGMKCPITYFDAFARLTIGYWYPDMNYRDVEAYHPYWEYYSTGILQEFDNNKYLLLEQKPVKGLEWLNEEFYELSYENSYQSIAIVSLFFSSGLSVWLVIFYIAICIYRKKYNYLVPAGFVFLFILTLLLGPVVLYRYIYPVCLACPLLLISAINFKNQDVEI